MYTHSFSTMALDPTVFSTHTPSQYISFTLPNPLKNHQFLHSPLIRVAVLDSPTRPASPPPRTAAMIVPLRRESDWIFSTFAGHLQLLLGSPDTDRLVLLGNDPSAATSSSASVLTRSFMEKQSDVNLTFTAPEPDLEEILMPLVISLCPKLGFDDVYNFRQIPFLSYDDGVISRVVVEICTGSRVGEMLVEDVEIRDEVDCKKTEFRRRLRFRRTPNLIQTQIRICPHSKLFKNECFGSRIGEMLVEDVEICDESVCTRTKFRQRLRSNRTPNLIRTEIHPSSNLKSCKKNILSGFLNTAVLVQPYLLPMVASISLVGLCLEEKIRKGVKPKALCLGVGGGALLSFLNTRLGFEVIGVEEDEAVLGLARRRFGLPDDTHIHIYIGDGVELINKLASTKNGEFDVVMVDLDTSEVGIGAMAPPMEFVEKSVLFAMCAVLSERGIIVVNVIRSSMLLYERMVGDFRKVFGEVYEIDVENGENFVLIGSRNVIRICSRDYESGFVGKLREAISGAFMESIRKI